MEAAGGSSSGGAGRLRKTFREVMFRLRPNLSRPTPEEAKSWATSIHVLLSSEYGKDLFMTFLRREFSEEYFEFYEAVEKYRNSKQKKLAKKAKEIVDEFIKPDAPKELVLEHQIKTDLMKKVEDLADFNVFDSVQNKIFAMLEAGNYPRFLEWNVYLNLVMPENQAIRNPLYN